MSGDNGELTAAGVEEEVNEVVEAELAGPTTTCEEREAKASPTEAAPPEPKQAGHT